MHVRRHAGPAVLAASIDNLVSSLAVNRAKYQFALRERLSQSPRPPTLLAALLLITSSETRCGRWQDTKRLFEGEALLRRMYRYGLLEEAQDKLDYVLALTPNDFLERRLQTLVFKLGLAKSIHHARVLIRQRHIRCGIRAA